MKKRTLIISLTCMLLVAVVIIGFAIFGGKKPYKDLDASQIASVSVRLTPPDKTVQIVDIEEFVAYLKDVVIYNEDNSYTEYSGQAVAFILTMTDGTQTNIMEYNPFLVIDGVGYKTKYEPCEALSNYANKLLKETATPAPAMNMDGSVDWEYDLDRNGVPEAPRLVTLDEGMGRRFELWEDSKLIWSEEGYSVHTGYNALFVCVLNGEAYLLRYNPSMYQGAGTYNYQLFSLENGKETVVQENSVDFDTNFYQGKSLYGEFDPEAIAAFMDEVNGLLSCSTQLLNTNRELLDTFAGKTVAPQDILGWLDLFDRDQSKSLLENLQAFQRAQQGESIAQPTFGPG